MPKKPHKDLPFYQHRSGQWAKKIKGRLCYFGSWKADPDAKAAMLDYQARLPWLLNGEEPPPQADKGRYSVNDVVNIFLTRKKRRLASGDIGQGMFGHYKYIGKFVGKFLGKTTPAKGLTEDDFERLREAMAKRFTSPQSLYVLMGSVKAMFVLGQRKGLVSRRLDFDECFERPSAKTLRIHRNKKKATQQFTPAEIRALLAIAKPAMKAMILLGIQAGMGNSDVGQLPLDCLKEPGWLNYPRSKTGVPRRIPLWKETTEALQAAIATRKKPKRNAKQLFITIYGNAYKSGSVGKSFDRVMKRAKLSGRKFYDLRRNFKTIGKNAKEPDALKAIMGHAAPESDMSARYDLGVEDSELRKVTDYVHAWLFGSPDANGETEGHGS